MGDVPDGFIDGDTAMITGFAAEGPSPELLGAQQPLQSRMEPAGNTLVTADQTSTQRLLTFVTAANTGIDHLTQTAKASGEIYLDGNEAARATLIGVVDLDPFAGAEG
jgi:hypothetical protein